MKRICVPRMLAVFTIAALSCGGDEMNDVFEITPGNGAVNISRNSNVTLTFAKSVDSGVVAANFHLMPAVAMDMMIDSVSMMAMTYEAMLQMMDRHGLTGQFVWTERNTRCLFDPDSMMTPLTAYRIHMGKQIMEIMGMHQPGGMMNMPSIMNEDMMIEFTTGN